MLRQVRGERERGGWGWGGGGWEGMQRAATVSSLKIFVSLIVAVLGRKRERQCVQSVLVPV